MLTALGVGHRAHNDHPATVQGHLGDAAAMASYLGSDDGFDRAMARFAETYADRNERDYAILKLAVDSGKLAAENA